jgi:hypothetical protein
MDSTVPTIAPGGRANALRAALARGALASVRKLALVAFAAWCLGVTGLAAYEFVTHQVGYFVALTLPLGTEVSGDRAALPDGRIVKLDRAIDVRTLAPGEIEWTDVPGVVELQPRATLIAIILLVPLAGWIALEAGALLAEWILRGFSRPPGS